jgi:hypothetical protein
MSRHTMIATFTLSVTSLIGCFGPVRSITPSPAPLTPSSAPLRGNQSIGPPTPQVVTSLEDRSLLYRYIGRSFDHAHHTDEFLATEEGARVLITEPKTSTRGHRCATTPPSSSALPPPGALLELIVIQHLSRLARERHLTDASWVRVETIDYQDLNHLSVLKTQFDLSSKVRCSAQLKAFTNQLYPTMESPLLEMMRAPHASLAEVSSELLWLSQRRYEESYILFFMMVYERDETYSGERLEENILCRSTAGPISLEPFIHVNPRQEGGLDATLGICGLMQTPFSPEPVH